jgi:hypothetical protein
MKSFMQSFQESKDKSKYKKWKESNCENPDYPFKRVGNELTKGSPKLVQHFRL